MTNIWDGFAPVGPSFSIRQSIVDYSAGWRNASGDEVRWWEGSTPDQRGIKFRPTACQGPSCAEDVCGCEKGCADCDTDLYPCNIKIAEPVHFKPFWIYAKHECCDEVSLPVGDRYQQLVALNASLGWSQLARRFHQELQAAATDLTGAAPSTIVEGIGTLIRNRGILGLGGGALIVPGYALPALQSLGLVTANGNTLVGPGNMPIITDPGIPVTGPGGAVPAPLSAYIYIVDQAPAGAILPHTTNTGMPDRYDHTNPNHRKLFGCETAGCYAPLVRQQAIVAFNPCGAFAIAVDVSGCVCAGPLPAPGEGAEG